MGVKIEWQSADSESNWDKARVYRGTSPDPQLMSQIQQQAISDTNYYDENGTSEHYYAITFYNSSSAIESEYSKVIKTEEVSPTYTTVQNVRNMMQVTDTSVLADSPIEKWVVYSEAELDEYTGRTWGEPELFTARFNSRETMTNTRSDIYQTADVDEYTVDFENLPHINVVDLEGVWFIQPQQTADYVYSDDGGSFTDNTDASQSMTGTPYFAFASSPAINDAIYIGNSNRFMGTRITITTAGDDGVVEWEYYDGSSWRSLDLHDEVDNEVKNLYRSGEITFFLPRAWQETTINSQEAYWIRGRVTTAHGTSPKMQYTRILDEIEDELDLHDLEVDEVGTVYFVGDNLSSGSQNLRIDYRAGSKTVPKLVENLATVLACIRGFIAISGGSYDDISTYTIGSMSVSLGEPYVNIREAITQLEKRRDELLGRIGKRHDLVST